MKFTDLPKDCEEAYKNGYKTGEVMIWPTATIKPFFVYCDMELVPNNGMCIAVFSGSPLYLINSFQNSAKKKNCSTSVRC